MFSVLGVTAHNPELRGFHRTTSQDPSKLQSLEKAKKLSSQGKLRRYDKPVQNGVQQQILGQKEGITIKARHFQKAKVMLTAADAMGF